MPVRKPPRGGRKNLGKFFSVKLNAVLWYESLLEMSFMYLLDFDPAVSLFKEQPCRIHFVNNGRKRTYTPDLLVVRDGRRQIIEVKPAKKAVAEKNLQLFHSVAPICARSGFEFLVVTDEMILQQPRLDNVKALWRYARTPLRPQHQIQCHKFFDGRQFAILTEVCEFFMDQGVPRQVVYALIFWGALDFDLTQPLRPDSLICLPPAATTTARKVS
jgi:TnsA endonuclease N terminal